MVQKYFLWLFVCVALLSAPSLIHARGITFNQLNSLKKASNGEIRVLVEFKNKQTPTRFHKNQKNAYLSRVLRRTSNGESLNGRFLTPNLRTLSATKDDLLNLLADDGLDIYEDKFHKPSLASSIPVIFPNQISSSFLGAGQVVAILDTGVAKDHSFLTNSVISSAEACFSTEDAGQFLESLCPGSVEMMVGSGAAVPCAASIDGCDHGTQMAGVIAGDSPSFNGVAPLSQIIPVQVYSRSNEELVCGTGNTPCIGALTSDIISGLNYINSIKSAYSIAAVNLSLGSIATYQGVCDVTEPASYLAEIASLVSSGITVIAASGNQGEANEMNSPACIADVIAVAATNNLDTPWPANNRNSQLDFFAPGVVVNSSSLPTSTFSSTTATSISAAHLSGAWAAMRSKDSNASLATIKNALTITGTSVTQGFFSKPRINLSAALGQLSTCNPPQECDTFFLPAIYYLLLED